MTDGEVRYGRDGEIATVIFDRPAARNAMTWRMYEQLGEACAQIRREDGLRVAVFRGAGGKAFIAGTDIAQFRAFRGGNDGIAYEEKMEAILAGVEALPVPTLAVIEGFAIGGGLAIAAACDLRIATPGSRFGVPIARTLGNCLSIANYARLIAALGASRGKRTAETVGGGAILGGLIGAIAGHGKGAAIGSVIGAGAGTAVEAGTKAPPMKIAPETKIDFTLKAPISVTLPPGRSSGG